MELLFLPITSEYGQAPFDCGEQDIQRMMDEAYFASLTRQAIVINAFYEGKIVGQAMITSAWIKNDDCNWSQGGGRHSGMKITYIAVKKELQHQGIGTCFLMYIIRYIGNRCKELPIRYIALKSVQNIVKWYSDCGFQRFTDDMQIPDEDDYTVPMYIDFIDRKMIEEYIESQL